MPQPKETSFLLEEEAAHPSAVREILEEFQSLVKSRGWARLVKTMKNMEDAIVEQLQAPARGVEGVLLTEGLKGQLRQVRDVMNTPGEIIEECLSELHSVEEQANAEEQE